MTAEGFVVSTEDLASGERFDLGCDRFINAAGLHASEIAATIEGLDPAHVPQTRYARGNYYGVAGRPAFSRLIYPVPEPGGLGVAKLRAAPKGMAEKIESGPRAMQ